jgi:hypothetical protein
MPCCSCPLRACACAGIRSTTKNPGGRCAPARSISRGSRPPLIRALLPPSRPAPARQGDARSPNYPGPSRCCLAHQRAAAGTCARERSSPASPRQPLPAAPGVGRPGAHTAPVRARPYPAPKIPSAPGIRPGYGRPRPSLPGTPISAHAAADPRRAPPRLKRVRAEVPSGLTPRTPATAGTATRMHIAAVPRIPGRQPARLGRQRQRRIRHASAADQQVALSVTASA